MTKTLPSPVFSVPKQSEPMVQIQELFEGDIGSLTPIRRAKNTCSFSWFREISLIHTTTHQMPKEAGLECRKGEVLFA
ncbi:hypothetical protein VNO77_39002 [Canavalia gladiata]|uniref:Uncharacterized protein n=1 Tax=Canavalia gladiata TaxID=3824 RepID=A0AAN9KA92_CANGL